MKYKENTETGQIIEDNGHLGKGYRDKKIKIKEEVRDEKDYKKILEPAEFRIEKNEIWVDSTKTKYDNYKKEKDLVEKKKKKKEELRKKHIDNAIKTQLDAVDNALTEEELNNI